VAFSLNGNNVGWGRLTADLITLAQIGANVSIEKSLYPKLSEATAQTGEEFPEFLSRNFERVLRRIELLWGEKEIVDYFDSLLLKDIDDGKKNSSNRIDRSDLFSNADRANRMGFPLQAVSEIVLLKQIHQHLFPAKVLNPYDPSSSVEAVPIKVSGSLKRPSENRAAWQNEAVQYEPVRINNKHLMSWPVFRTQQELADIAELQRKGENIYPLQGKQMGEILLHYGVIDDNNVNVVLALQKDIAYKNLSIGEILLGVGLIKQDELNLALLVQAGIPMVDIVSIDIPPEISKVIPRTRAREKRAVPIGSYHDMLFLAVADPFSFAEVSFFTVMTGMKISLVFAPADEIIKYFNVHGVASRHTGASKQAFRNQASRDTDFSYGPSVDTAIVITDVSENDSVIINLVNQMILNAIQEAASDIHIELFNDGRESSVRFRRDGNMEDFENFPRIYHKAVVSRIKIMSNMDISETRRPQDGKISFTMPNGGQVDLRVVTIPASPGVEFVTIRILSSGEPLPLGELGFIQRDMDVFREVCQRPYGLILVCGPTGSGKTTTLHSVLKELNIKERKIWTVEDPVEIVQPHLCQVQVNSKIGMTFATVLRSLLRADPDVIMIGEMRDDETAKIALEASMTGHLVLSTLHTNSASETVSRLLGLDIDPYNLSDALQAILAQRLARKLCVACAIREEASASEIEDLAEEYYQSAHNTLPTPAARIAIIDGWHASFGDTFYLMHPVGCELCDKGYKGRIGLYELLRATPSLRHLIRQQSAASEYLAAGVEDGMRTLKQDGIEKVLSGITDMIQVRSACI
jgi:type II secretory ATPase GspE/PulE/Tfp pilus assembly ATPase PilB-like protein